MSLRIETPRYRADSRIAVLSPHLDDAVLSCGTLLSQCHDATVITLFAGTPDDRAMRTGWDRECGFASAAAAMAARRDEDRRALAILGADARHLNCLDGQYLASTHGDAHAAQADVDDMDDIENAAALAAALAALQPDVVVVPLGVFHSDHFRARRAWMHCLGAPSGGEPEIASRQWVAYEDVPYRCMEGALQHALSALHQAGFCATPTRWDDRPPASAPVPPPGVAGEQRKREALRAYASQLTALGEAALADAFAPERFWAIARVNPNISL